ncbi:LysR family transcriptional regulator [Actinophytocola sp.]|uniref:LysR family transcriptional regulator n=1 Tax=Actinophytocola sp. TaxID=1872138 RepID=UPI002D7EE5C5|nr:LysR family transcriptional regulator [Actinophytocola sp.]HET9138673.1 LysR family transcriptional regulator [Actinophytocola sp.]
MPDVELRHLAALAAVADEGSFGRAAARLGYTQSTVSQQIAALERAVGGPVFDRPGGPKPVRITPLGAVVLGHGRELLAQAERLADAVDRFNAGEGRIDIGTFQSVSNVILPAVVRRLRDEHPGCDIRLSEEEPEQPRIGDLDLLFYDGTLDGDVEHVKLLDEPYLLVTGRGVFPDGPVRLEQLDQAPMVAWPLTCDQPWMERALERSGARPRVVFRSAINDTLLSMVRAGLGSAVLPWLAIRAAEVQSDHRLRVHELRPSLPPREIHLHWPAARTRSPLAARAIAIAIEVAAEVATQIANPTRPVA